MTFGRELLHHPDLFPGRRSGEAWGGEALDLEIASDRYAVTGLGEEQAAVVRERFGAFRPRAAEPGAGIVQVRLFTAPASDFRPLETAGRGYRLELDYQPRAVRLAGLGLMARLDWARLDRQPALTAALWSPFAGGEAFLGAFENLLRVLVAYRLVESGGALLHSAGVVSGGAACLFFGRSGAGKTTVCRLAREQGRELLSDDLNALRLRQGRATVLPVPFAGDFAAAAPCCCGLPLDRLLRLEKGGVHRLRPLGRSAALAALVTCAPFVNADPHRVDRLLTNLEVLTRKVPVGLLTFRRDPGFWELIPPHPGREVAAGGETLDPVAERRFDRAGEAPITVSAELASHGHS